MMDRDSHFLEVLRACRHPDLRLRLNALEELEKVYLDQVKADFLLVLLGKTSIYQEQSAILGIMSLMGPRAPVEELTHILLDRDKAPGSLREAVAGTLAALEEDAPVDVLIDILRDPTEEAGLREEIAGLLGTFGERVPLEVLVAAAADAEPGVRAAGIGSLMAQGSRAPLEPITAALGHAEWYVRMEAVKALGHAISSISSSSRSGSALSLVEECIFIRCTIRSLRRGYLHRAFAGTPSISPIARCVIGLPRSTSSCTAFSTSRSKSSSRSRDCIDTNLRSKQKL